jgi:alpha-ketoglutarate-dependent taurine dioxygenase
MAVLRHKAMSTLFVQNDLGRAMTVVAGVWRIATEVSNEQELARLMVSLAASFGRLVTSGLASPIQALMPRSRVDAPRNSLSGRFGNGTFPLHTDLAQWITPPRYVILGAVRASPKSARTTLAPIPPLSPRDFRDVAAGIFAVSNGRRSFLASICASTRPFFRFDVGCMAPLDECSRDAQSIFNQLVTQGNRETLLEWRCGDIAVIDNWNVLHGRTPVTNADDRRLLRAYVEA